MPAGDCRITTILFSDSKGEKGSSQVVGRLGKMSEYLCNKLQPVIRHSPGAKACQPQCTGDKRYVFRTKTLKDLRRGAEQGRYGKANSFSLEFPSVFTTNSAIFNYLNNKSISQVFGVKAFAVGGKSKEIRKAGLRLRKPSQQVPAVLADR